MHNSAAVVFSLIPLLTLTIAIPYPQDRGPDNAAAPTYQFIGGDVTYDIVANQVNLDKFRVAGKPYAAATTVESTCSGKFSIPGPNQSLSVAVRLSCGNGMQAELHANMSAAVASSSRPTADTQQAMAQASMICALQNQAAANMAYDFSKWNTTSTDKGTMYSYNGPAMDYVGSDLNAFTTRPIPGASNQNGASSSSSSS